MSRRPLLRANVDLGVVARGTPGFSGADLSNVVNEAALLAARKEKNMVDMQDLDDAKDKVLMGVERRSMVISEEEKKNTAYHEAGHTLVAKLIPGTDPIHKVSIIPRGMALGVTMQLPIEDKHSYSRESLLNRIAVLMGGRAAEEIIFNSKTTGAGNDIERATEIARKMVCEWGMSEKLGPVTFGKKDEQIFLGREMASHKNYSEATAVEIDGEIRHIVDESYIAGPSTPVDNIDILHRLSLELIEKENLGGAEVDAIVKGGDVPSAEMPKQEKLRSRWLNSLQGPIGQIPCRCGTGACRPRSRPLQHPQHRAQDAAPPASCSKDIGTAGRVIF